MNASASDMLEFIGGSGYLAKYMTAASGFNGLRGPRGVNLYFGFCEVCRSLACGPHAQQSTKRLRLPNGVHRWPERADG